jgi:aldehyde:ferredoxin oxidoreductase
MGGLSSSDSLEGYKHLTGRDVSMKEGLKVDERIVNLARAFNAREEFGRKDDTMPERILTEPVKGGPTDGARVEDFGAMLDVYYTECGWDVEAWWPTRAKLEELELKDAADQLYK